MARIERLPEEPKRLLQTASVLGRAAPLRVLEAMWGDPEDLAGCLRQLERRYSDIVTADEVIRHMMANEG